MSKVVETGMRAGGVGIRCTDLRRDWETQNASRSYRKEARKADSVEDFDGWKNSISI